MRSSFVVSQIEHAVLIGHDGATRCLRRNLRRIGPVMRIVRRNEAELELATWSLQQKSEQKFQCKLYLPIRSKPTSATNRIKGLAKSGAAYITNRIGELRGVEYVKKFTAELQGLVLPHAEVLEQGEIPVKSGWACYDVSPHIPILSYR